MKKVISKKLIIMALVGAVLVCSMPSKAYAKKWMDPACVCATASLTWTGSEVQAKTTGRKCMPIDAIDQDVGSCCVGLYCYNKKDGSGKNIWANEAWKKKPNKEGKNSTCLVNNHNYSSVKSTKTWHMVYNKKGQLMFYYGLYKDPIISNANKNY